MLYKLWIDTGSQQVFCEAAPDDVAESAQLQSDMKQVWRVHADSRFEAMSKYYEHMGWGKYEAQEGELHPVVSQQNHPATIGSQVSWKIRLLYFLLSFFAAATISALASSARVRATGVSNFEGAAGYAAVLQWPLWFAGFLLLFWLAYIPLRRHYRSRIGAITLFGLLTLPVAAFVFSLL